ncbi:RNA-directed DNA polymerase, eukaryota, reverse transcriptase zinc-binding domain protein [Tanacetum coccineum]
MEEFSKCSGLIPNKQKSTILFGSMPLDDQQFFLDIVPFVKGNLPMRYLGVPLITKRLGIKDCKPLIDKIKVRVHNWKNKCLSYAGRLLLIASILESIHVYWATVFLIPKAIIKDINKLLKGFLWCNGEISRGKAKVAWKNVCKPRDKGGLGLKDLEVWNKVLLTKHIWNIASKKDSLWVKWASVVKLKQRNFWEIQYESNDSWGWKNLLSIRNEVRRNIVHIIGDGSDTSLWFDNWSSLGPLCDFVTYRDIYDARLRPTCTVQELIKDGCWNWPEGWNEKFPQVSNIGVPNNKSESDKVVWRTNEGRITDFNVSQAYYDMSTQWNSVSWRKIVWFSHCIPKHAFIMWMAINGKLMTQDRLKRWGIYDMMVCPLCKKGEESHSDLFFECEFARSVWKGLSVLCKVNTNSMKWKDIVDEFCSKPNGKSIWSVVRRLTLAAAVYLLWKERNGRIFRDEEMTWLMLLEKIMETVKMKLLGLKVKRSFATNEVDRVWEIKLQTVHAQNVMSTISAI